MNNSKAKIILQRIYKNKLCYFLLFFPVKIFRYVQFHVIPEKIFLKHRFYNKVGYRLNLEDPQTFNEKLQWLKLYDRKPEYTKLVDKYAVRGYVANTIGEEYLVPLIGVWDKFESINIETLPNQFVLKTTHDSGGVIICNDKATFNFIEAGKKINRKLNMNYYYLGKEHSYYNIKPQIIGEELLINDSGEEVKDYKFLCFNGKVKCSFVCSNRYSSNGLNVDFFDLDWNHMPFERHYPSNTIPPNKPINYKKMIEISEKYSKNITFIRIDFFEINGKLFLGEFTFYPGCGFEEFTPEYYDYLLGSWINLPR